MSRMAKMHGERKDRAIESLVASFGELVVGQLEDDAGFAKLESTALELGNELVRLLLQKQVQSKADGYGDLVRVNHHHDEAGRAARNDVVYKRHQSGTGVYWSLVGKLEIRRSSYRVVGVRNGPTIVPLELEAGLVEGMTPNLAKSVTLGYSKGPLRSYGEDVLAAHRIAPPRATLERKAKAVAARAHHVSFFVEPVLREQECIPEGTTMVVLGVDRTSVPMAEPAKPLRRRRRRSKPYQRKRPDPVTVNWRMDYAATITFLDAAGEVLATRRYHAPSDSANHHVVDGIVSDLEHARKQNCKLRVVVAQDGAPELWNTLRYWLDASDVVDKWTEVLDWYHASERLHRCLAVIEPDAGERGVLAKKWSCMLLKKDSGPRRLVEFLRRHAGRYNDERDAELKLHANYFEQRLEQMRYRKYKKANIPIGSGITEGTCKSLIGARAKRSGQRWSRGSLNAVLRLRGIHQSDRFDRFWDHCANHYRASRVAAA